MAETINFDQESSAFLDIIDIVVGKGAYDTTIRAIIIEAADKSVGKYKVSYQGNTFYAYAEGNTNYRKGTEVFILVPKNDFSEEKRIIGSVSKLTEEYLKVKSYLDIYKPVGSSGFEYKDKIKIEIGKVSSDSNSIILYDKDNQKDNYLSLNKYFLDNLKDSKTDTLWLQAKFRTNLKQLQYTLNNSNADYGLRLTFSRLDENNQSIQQRASLNVNYLTGEPFQQSGDVSAHLFISNVNWSEVSSIDKLEFFSENFNIVSNIEDLFVNDIQLYAAQTIGERVPSDTNLTLETPQGTRIDDLRIEHPEDQEVIESISLKATLTIDSLVQQDNVNYYWFKENRKITTESNNKENNIIKYSSIGGSGWEILNGGTFDENDPTIIHWDNTDKNEWVFFNEDLNFYETRVKCVARYKETSYEDISVLYNYNISEYFILDSDKESFSGSTDIITLEIEPTKVFKDEFKDQEVIIKALLYKKGKYDENPSFLADIENLKYTEKGENILDNAIYYAEVSVWRKNSDSVEKPVIEKYITNTLTLVFKEQTSRGETFLEIENGDQIFKYSQEGYSPASNALVNSFPQVILPLKARLQVSKDGILEPISSPLENIKWNVPEEETLIVKGEEEDKEQYIFGIKPYYDPSAQNNQITVEVTYNKHTYRAKTNFLFLRESGSNLIQSHVENIIIEAEQEITNMSISKVTFKAYSYMNGIKNETPLEGYWSNYEDSFSNSKSYYYEINDFNSHTPSEIFGEKDSQSGAEILPTLRIPKFLYGDKIIAQPFQRATLYELPRGTIDISTGKERTRPTVYDLSYTPYIYYDPLTNTYSYKNDFKWNLDFPDGKSISYQFGNTGTVRDTFQEAYSDMIENVSYLHPFQSVIDIIVESDMVTNKMYRLQYLVCVKDEKAFVDKWDGTLSLKKNSNNFISKISAISGVREANSDNNGFTGVLLGEIEEDGKKTKDVFAYNDGNKIGSFLQGIIPAKTVNEGENLDDSYSTFLNKIEPVKYEKNGSTHIGLKSENIEVALGTLPFGSLVKTENGQCYYDINEIIPLLIQEIKRLNKRIDELNN